jgi:hypothetical protein
MTDPASELANTSLTLFPERPATLKTRKCRICRLHWFFSAMLARSSLVSFIIKSAISGSGM